MDPPPKAFGGFPYCRAHSTRGNTMSRANQAKQPVHLQLIGNGSADPFIGVHAVPGRLPQLLRYPGESAQAFCNRALHHVTGTGALWAMLMYASEHGPVQ